MAALLFYVFGRAQERPAGHCGFSARIEGTMMSTSLGLEDSPASSAPLWNKGSQCSVLAKVQATCSDRHWEIALYCSLLQYLCCFGNVKPFYRHNLTNHFQSQQHVKIFIKRILACSVNTTPWLLKISI